MYLNLLAEFLRELKFKRALDDIYLPLNKVI
jgi:hypothetical protein